ncbi:hypothetical protein YPPY46_1916 [Yersinia pestis PY-46]|uniref:Uncharacterized protein n=1 Tax=Yersinia pestis TaxID=632 RepID=Q8CL96_YERPE|nr:hypothetical [Yersinia pestis KIM10+]EIS06084.1 hypothetical protein YPPY46_1916 [Yersinia pestis PY-46]EIT47195.1 hypothetical protein YPPY100_1903 [Yersinia pestis PY-100]
MVKANAICIIPSPPFPTPPPLTFAVHPLFTRCLTAVIDNAHNFKRTLQSQELLC